MTIPDEATGCKLWQGVGIRGFPRFSIRNTEGEARFFGVHQLLILDKYGVRLPPRAVARECIYDLRCVNVDHYRMCERCARTHGYYDEKLAHIMSYDPDGDCLCN